MNTEYLAVNVSATVHDAIEALRHFEGGVETVSTIYLVDSQGTLAGRRAPGQAGAGHS